MDPEVQFDPGDLVVFTSGKFEGRDGEFYKNCSKVFPDRARVKVYSKKEGKEPTIEFVLRTDFKLVKKAMSKKKKDEAVAAVAVPTLEYIKLSEIFSSPLNPRKEFHEAELAELVESIKKLGVIQPITVRKAMIPTEPAPDTIKMVSGYEVVCGERRWRCAQVAGLTEIPCSVRDLTDAEAMELMVTENLQRKDVSPFEEADAFVFMLDQMKYELADVAARIGKNESFVSRRLQLKKLIEPLRHAFDKAVISLGHCELLSRVSEEDQEYWLKNHLYGYNGAGTISSLKTYLNSKAEKMLAKATFPLDAEFAGIMPCVSCPSNSACNQSLFPDKQEYATCHNSTCYTRKTEAKFLMNLEVAKDDPFTILVEEYSHMPSDIVANLKSEGFTVLKQYDDYNRVYNITEPEEPLRTDYDLDDYDSTEELEAAYAADLSEYNDDLHEYNTQIKQIESAESQFKKAFVVIGSDAGKYIYITLKSKGVSAVNSAVDPVAEQKSKILVKQKRGYELDQEKLHKNLVEHLRKLPIRNDDKAGSDSLNSIESALLIVFAYQYASFNHKIINPLLGFDKNKYFYHDGDELIEAIKDASEPVRSFIVRTALFSHFSGHTANSVGGSIIFELAKTWDPEGYAKMFAEQDAIKNKRDKRYEERLAELDK